MPLKKKIRRSPVDDYMEIAKAAQIKCLAFRLLQKTSNYAAVKSYRETVEMLFQHFDARWVTLCGDDEGELTMWGARMGVVRDNLDELDRSLAFSGKRQFNWERVLAAMGLLDALKVATELTLMLNE